MLVEIRHPNGVVLSYDDEIVVGSVITAYHAGYWRVTAVTNRPGGTPHCTYVQLAKADGRVVNGKAEKGCDASYCRLLNRETINKQHDEQLKAADDLYNTLMGFLE